MELIAGERVKSISESVARGSISTPAIVAIYKQVWAYIKAHDGVTFTDISRHFGWGYGQTRCMVDGASLYSGAKIYEEIKHGRNGKKIVLKWMED